MLLKTLFSRTLSIITSVSVAYLIFSFSVIAYFMLVPVGKQSANDLASLMIFSANRWAEISVEERAEFEQDLFDNYQLKINNNQHLESVDFKPLPYYYFLESSLKRRIHKDVYLKISQDENGIDWYWTNLTVKNKNVRIGFSSAHINVHPPLVLILLLVVGGFAALSTAAILVRNLTTPLEKLSQNAQRVGSGVEPDLIPETGPKELVTLAKSFNKMAVQVKELLTNRTTLLAGISHDLRTPLARIQLAIDMLPQEVDPVLIDGIHADVGQMNCLIGQFLELSKSLEKGQQQNIDLVKMLDDLVNCARRGGASIKRLSNKKCTVANNPMALQRIVVNLLENAVRYGEGNPVEVGHFCDENNAVIIIKDRGLGIPENEIEAIFRPFYRLDKSRNIETGGTGLGLSIASQLADINGIKIKLYARNEAGTVAEVVVPKNIKIS